MCNNSLQQNLISFSFFFYQYCCQPAASSSNEDVKSQQIAQEACWEGNPDVWLLTSWCESLATKTSGKILWYGMTTLRSFQCVVWSVVLLFTVSSSPAVETAMQYSQTVVSQPRCCPLCYFSAYLASLVLLCCHHQPSVCYQDVERG